jgi:hypothetical protein
MTKLHLLPQYILNNSIYCIQDLEHGRYALKVPSAHTRDQRNNGQAERAWYTKVVKELDEAKCPDTRPEELSEYVGT